MMLDLIISWVWPTPNSTRLGLAHYQTQSWVDPASDRPNTHGPNTLIISWVWPAPNSTRLGLAHYQAQSWVDPASGRRNTHGPDTLLGQSHG